MTIGRRLPMLTIAVFFAAFSLADDEVTGWRDDGDGLFPDANPPLTWSADSNIVWKTKMPEWSNAHPVAVGDRLFVNAEPNTLVCVDRNSGKIIWQRTNSYEDALDQAEVERLRKGSAEKAAPLLAEKAEREEKLNELYRQLRENDDQTLRGKIRGQRLKIDQLRKRINEVDPLHEPDRHDANGYTSAVPISDGRLVYAVYGNGVVSCFDLEGKRQWSKFVQKPDHSWGHSASPVLAGDVLVVHILNVVAFDRKTGEERWRASAKESWGSPIALEIGGEPLIVTAGTADVIRAKDGVKLVENLGGLKFATPIVQDGAIYFIENKASAYALPKAAGPDMAFEKRWESRIKGSRHYASSLIHDGLIYAVSREGWLSVLEQDSGELVYERRLDPAGDNRNSVYPSLSYAGGHVFIGFEEGVTLALKPGREYVEVARNELERYRGTPLFLGDRIYLRGLEHLYCLGSI